MSVLPLIIRMLSSALEELHSFTPHVREATLEKRKPQRELLAIASVMVKIVTEGGAFRIGWRP
ncbi:hypothetical protein POPTR_018G105150v4 [Populus trichocarpa]|uniref:Uncharacterized protein n=1 Tax=Populus trichocarpa TaxID=3694 RepID=A0ACC0RNY7_POPTR|nr:hypothetical protein POPTR_018G105150v4 [Populus trichocarpa]